MKNIAIIYHNADFDGKLSNGRNIMRCLNNLVDAVELLGDAVNNHYHTEAEEDRY